MTIKFPPEIEQRLQTAMDTRTRPVPFLTWALPSAPGTCENCGGAEYVYVLWIDGGPYSAPTTHNKTFTSYEGSWYSYKRVGYPCPACQDSAKVALAGLVNTGLLETETGLSLHYYDGRRGKRQAVAAIKSILALRTPLGWYSLFGTYGTGKSSLLKILTAEFARRGFRAHYTRAEDMLTKIRDTFGDNPQDSERQIRETYGRFQFLAIDEVDRISTTGWAKASMMCLLDERYRRQEYSATAIATNKNPEELTGDFAYLASRMRDGRKIPVGGGDLRGAK